MQKHRAMLTNETAEAIDEIRVRGNFGNRGQAIDFILELYQRTRLPETLTECIICGQWIIVESRHSDCLCDKKTCEIEFGRQDA